MTGDVAPLTPREALALEEYAGVTAMAALEQVLAGRQTVRVAVGLLWVLGARENPELTPDAVLDSYATYGDLYAAATEALDGEG